ncbi:MAG: IclR family transcriptional regulator [Bifidobacteriaceae bacterium]|jgi:DNA-binding IclR family transcriptional regulator|nr:IclR family transcriptional regulator [Bifidobacteriaceae bacterium]
MTDKQGQSLAPAVTRAVRVLDILAEAGGAPTSLAEIARGLGAAKSSVLNICGVLESGGLIQRRDGGYALGWRTAELGAAYLRSFDVVREFHRLTQDSEVLRGELVNLGLLAGTDALYLGRHEGTAPLRLSAGVGDRLPAALTALGGALLGQLSATDLAARFRSYSFPRLTERSTDGLAQLRAKLAADRDRGYALDLGESTPGVIGVGMPVPPARPGRDPWAVSVSLIVGSGRESEFPADRAATVVRALRDLARRLTNPMSPAGLT